MRGGWWKTTEHLFQALRFPESSPVRHEIFRQASPMGAKMTAKRHKVLRSVIPLSDKDLENMQYCLRLKLDTHRKVREGLMATGNKTLIEDISSRPKKNDPWGMRLENGLWVGHNILGFIWMELRTELTSAAKIGCCTLRGAAAIN